MLSLAEMALIKPSIYYCYGYPVLSNILSLDYFKHIHSQATLNKKRSPAPQTISPTESNAIADNLNFETTPKLSFIQLTMAGPQSHKMDITDYMKEEYKQLTLSCMVQSVFPITPILWNYQSDTVILYVYLNIWKPCISLIICS